MGWGRFVPPRSEYVCPHCRAPLVETGRARLKSFLRGISRPIMACTNCKTSMEGPPHPRAFSRARVRAILFWACGVVLIVLGIVFGGLVEVALALIGVLIIAGGIAVIASIVRSRALVDSWQQYRRM